MYRRLVEQLASMPDGSIRITGLILMGAGALLLQLIN